MKDMKMLIGGAWVDASDGQVIENYAPYTGELIGTVPAATKEDVDRAVALAKEGQKEWAGLRNDERDAILNRFISLYEEKLEEIAALSATEGGKAIAESRRECQQVPQILRAYMHAANCLYGQTLPHDTERRNMGDMVWTVYEPLGVCALIGPFNYPISTMYNKIAPAICGGNAIVIKPASDTPMAILLCAELMLKAGMPANAVQVVTGSGEKIGTWLTANKDVAEISLTGSTEVGVKTFKNAGDHLMHVSLELGGNDPLFVFDDCDLDLAVAQAIGGRVYNTGQICSASKRFIVQNGVKEAFTRKLIEGLKEVKYGEPLDEESIITCMINKAAADKYMDQIRHTVEQGATLAFGGQRFSDTRVEAVVFTDVTPQMDIAVDMEVFGPAFPIIGFDTLEKALQIANASTYGLSSGVMTRDIKTGIQVANGVKSGTCVINGTGDWRTSYHGFGGFGMSGVGREGAAESLKEFMEVKTMVLRGVFAK